MKTTVIDKERKLHEGTLAEITAFLLEGARWRRPSKPWTVGRFLNFALEMSLFDPETEVKLETFSSHEGYGPDFRYIYSFTVHGVEIPRETIDKIIEADPNNLYRLRVWSGDGVIRFTW